MKLLLILAGAGGAILLGLVIYWLRRHGDQVAEWMQGDSGDSPAATRCFEEDLAEPCGCGCARPKSADSSLSASAPVGSPRAGLTE